MSERIVLVMHAGRRTNQTHCCSTLHHQHKCWRDTGVSCFTTPIAEIQSDFSDGMASFRKLAALTKPQLMIFILTN